MTDYDPTTDPHATRKCHAVARAYHQMRGDLEPKEGDKS